MRLSHCAPLCAAALFGLAVPLFAQSAPATTVAPTTATKIYSALPAGLTAEKILDRFIQASGGKAALSKVKSSVQKGTLTLAAQNITGSFVIYTRRPNRFYTAQEFPGIGKTEVGYDGTVVWSNDPINGVRILKGAEAAQLKRQVDSDVNRAGDWRGSFKKSEALGVRKVDGKDAYAIRLTPAAGKPIVQYFDPQSGLMVRMDMIQQGAQGTIPVESYFSDYRTVDGQKVPFLLRQKMAAVEVVTTMTEIKNNVSIPDSKFVKP